MKQKLYELWCALTHKCPKCGEYLACNDNQFAYGNWYCPNCEVDSESTDEKAIAKYLYEKKGYPIDLNGNLPSFDETMKDVEKYNKYKEDTFIKKAEKWLDEHILDYVYAKEWGQGVGVEGELFDDFKKYIKGE